MLDFFRTIFYKKMLDFFRTNLFNIEASASTELYLRHAYNSNVRAEFSFRILFLSYFLFLINVKMYINNPKDYFIVPL